MAQAPKAALAKLKTTPQDMPDIVTEDGRDINIHALQAEIVSDVKVTLNDDKAAWYIDLPVFEAEREVGNAHVQFLYDEMKNGTFNAASVIMASAWLGDVRYKINGQHTAWAVIFLPGFKMEVRELTFRVEDEEQLRLLYGTFDRGKKRSETHLMRVGLAGEPELLGVGSRVIGRLSSGLRFWVCEKYHERVRMRSTDTVALVKAKYLLLFRAVGEFLKSNRDASSTFVDRVPVSAALLETFHKVVTIAPEFWSRVLSGEGLEKGDARLTLRNYLMSTVVAGPGLSTAKRQVEAEAMYRCCILAWNHWRAGTKVTELKTPRTRIKAK